MVCPKCGGSLIEIDQETAKELGALIRKKVCISSGCGEVCYTYEKRIEGFSELEMTFYMSALRNENKRENKNG